MLGGLSERDPYPENRDACATRLEAPVDPLR